MTGIVSSELTGVGRDGRPVTFQISPHNKQSAALNTAVLVDRSGSMSAQCTYSDDNSETQHEAVVRGLREMQPLLVDGDRLALWEFDTDCDRVGEFNCNNPGEFKGLLSMLGDPRGGTSIGSALEQVCASEEGRDILLITDGQSYDLDVQRLAKSGNRIFVVLVGEGSLEAMVGHLAVLSGGDIHFSFGADVGQAIQACIEGMRQQSIHGACCDLNELGLPERVVTAHNNASIEASWSQEVENPQVSSEFTEAVAAYAASLAFAGAEEKWAANIAVQAGLVTHLTSLVLVAEDAQIQEDLPRTIKQAIPAPRGMKQFYSAPPSVAYASAPNPGICYSAPRHLGIASLDETDRLLDSVPPRSPIRGWDPAVSLGRQIDWNSEGSKLAQGQLGGIPQEIAIEITDFAQEVEDFADQLGMSSHIFVIALAAYAVQESSKWAARVYRRIIREYDQERFERIALVLRYTR